MGYHIPGSYNYQEYKDTTVNIRPLALFDNINHTHHPKSPYSKGLAKEGGDFLQAQGFLHHYRGHKENYNAYRRELERFLHWCWLVKGGALPLITPSDIHHFVEFCQNPPSSWCGLKKGIPRFLTVEGRRRPNPEWRPFMMKADGELFSNKSITELYRSLMLFFDYCALDRYVSANPAKRAWREAKSIFKTELLNSSPPPALKNELWLRILDTINQAAAEAPHYERTLFIMNLMTDLHLRVSDLVATQDYMLTMGNFYQDDEGLWRFRIETPGRPFRNTAVSEKMLKALKRYRGHLQLTPLPKPNEAIPLLSKQKGNGPITDTSSLRKMVKHAFNLTRQKLKENGLDNWAQELENAQLRWLRNTAVTKG